MEYMIYGELYNIIIIYINMEYKKEITS